MKIKSAGKRYKYYTCDVFTNTPFGGNQLAVFPDAVGLDKQTMQKITREFNYSECAFVFPPERDADCRVRIFTPGTEVPFAGHPNIGTAFILHSIGMYAADEKQEIIFEESAGNVPISISRDDRGNLFFELAAPQPLSLGLSISKEMAASATSLPVEAISSTHHQPVMASVGLPFLFIELTDRKFLADAKAQIGTLQEIADQGISPDMYIYYRSESIMESAQLSTENAQFDVNGRMFAPLDGITEDPATGSANCALAGLLAHQMETALSGEIKLTISQGIEMGRPSILHARALFREGEVASTYIGGNCILVSEGDFFV